MHDGYMGPPIKTKIKKSRLILDGYMGTTLPLCAACDNYADPRCYHTHPKTKKPVMVCDGCVCWDYSNDRIERTDQKIIEMDNKRLTEEIIDQ